MNEQKMPYFMVGSLSSIQYALSEQGEFYNLDRFAYVYIKETGNLAIIDPEKVIHLIKGDNKQTCIRVSVLPDVEEADIDTLYILDNIVYTFDGERFAPTYENVSYDEISNTPIKNVVGTIDNRIVISELENGTYNVSGEYVIANGGTVYITTTPLLFVKFGNYITKIEPNDITNYFINDGKVIPDPIITKSYLDQQGYADTAYIDDKMIEISDELKADIDQYIDDSIEDIDNQDINNLFQ